MKFDCIVQQRICLNDNLVEFVGRILSGFELGGEASDFGEFFGVFAEAFQVFKLEFHAGVLFELGVVAVEEIPVEGGEGAGAGTDAVFGVEAAAGAIVAHLVDVVAAGYIGFTADQAAIAVLTHTECVGE